MKKFLLVILSVFLIHSAFAQGNKGVNIRFENKKTKGYYNTTQISLLMGNQQVTEHYYYTNDLLSSSIAPYYNYTPRTEMQVSPSLTMTNGYMFNEHWAAGIGLGFEIFNRNLFPIFADVRYTLWDNKVSPFFAVKTGYAIGNLKKKHYDELYIAQGGYYNDVYFRNCGGFMLHPEMGVKIPLSENADLLFTVAYRHQKIKSKVTRTSTYYYYFDEWEHKERLNRLAFGVAIMFR